MRTRVIGRVKKANLRQTITDMVADDATLMTDELQAYVRLAKDLKEMHLHRYVDEFAFRSNYRRSNDAGRREAALKLAPGCRLTCK